MLPGRDAGAAEQRGGSIARGTGMGTRALPLQDGDPGRALGNPRTKGRMGFGGPDDGFEGGDLTLDGPPYQ